MEQTTPLKPLQATGDKAATAILEYVLHYSFLLNMLSKDYCSNGFNYYRAAEGNAGIVPSIN